VFTIIKVGVYYKALPDNVLDVTNIRERDDGIITLPMTMWAWCESQWGSNGEGIL